MVSDEVCGYLRHLESGFCVRVETTSTVSSLIADEMCSSDLDQYFCHSTIKKIMTVRSTSRSGETIMGTVSFDKTLDIQFIPQARVTSDTKILLERWRFKANGRIRSELKRSQCWRRSADTAKITLGECDCDEEEEEEGEARSHKFALQIRKDKPGTCQFFLSLFMNNELWYHKLENFFFVFVIRD